MSQPFAGVVNLDITNSVPDWGPYLPPKAPEGAPNVLYIAWDDVGFRRWMSSVVRSRRRTCGLPTGGPLLELPHDGAVLADAVVPPDRSQSHDERDGHHHRVSVGVPDLDATSRSRADHRRSAR